MNSVYLFIYFKIRNMDIDGNKNKLFLQSVEATV